MTFCGDMFGQKPPLILNSRCLCLTPKFSTDINLRYFPARLKFPANVNLKYVWKRGTFLGLSEIGIWFGVWIMVSEHGLSPWIFLSDRDSSCICFYPSVSHVLAHLKSPAFL